MRSSYHHTIIPEPPTDLVNRPTNKVPVVNSPLPGPSRPQHSRERIVIRESTSPPSSQGIKRPANTTVDSAVYESICQRRATQPKLICFPKPLQLPPPKENGWSYTTATKQ